MANESVTKPSLLVEWLGEQGFSDAHLESQGDLLIVKLSAPCRIKLLTNADLREQLITHARGFGFIRVALDLPHSEGGSL